MTFFFLEELMGKIGDGSSETSMTEIEQAKRQKQQYTQNLSKLTKNLHVYEGKIETLGEDIENMDRQLNSGKYKFLFLFLRWNVFFFYSIWIFRNVLDQYEIKMIEYETTEMMIDDLMKVSKSIDESLQQYHHLKIEQINKIIRELWTFTYRGNDIDSIELSSGLASFFVMFLPFLNEFSFNRL